MASRTVRTASGNLPVLQIRPINVSKPSDEEQREMLVAQALADYMNKCDSGVEVDREAFIAQHPELSEQLEELLGVADWVEGLAGPTAEESSADISDVERTLPPIDPEETLPPLQNFATISDQSQSEGFIDETTKNRDGLPANSMSLSQPILPCRFGDYVLQRVLGRGGMGVVYFGRQSKLERPVAVKMIRSGALASHEEVVRFYTEARSAAKLDHPNIVTVYQCGEQNGHHYFSMDYVAGSDLAKLSKDEPLEPKLAARYVRDAARAIQYAHDQGIVHRDLKPANLLVDENDNIRITDFGLAKSVDCESGLTATGATLGTPSYMSPEQAAGQAEQQQQPTDIYSLGAILFATVTGRPPFKASSVVQTIMQVIHRQAPRASSVRPEIGADLDTIIDVCLQKAPERRYSSAGELADDLDRYLVGAPIDARPMSATRRAWYWLLGVPIFGAVLDNRVVEPTDAHRWVQRGLISILLMLIVAWGLLLVPKSVWQGNRIPRRVTIAAGSKSGNYHQLATVLSQHLSENYKCDAEVVLSAGSVENREKLIRGEADLALMQGDAIDSSFVTVVAPLYYEVVHVLVRDSVDVASLDDLRGKSIRVGSKMAGTHRVARLLLEYSGLSIGDVEIDETPLDQTLEPDSLPDVVLIVAKAGSGQVRDVLAAGYKLFSFADAWQFSLREPRFHQNVITEADYPDCGLTTGPVTVVALAAFLVAKQDTSSALVTAALTHLFTPESVAATGILSAHDVAHWPDNTWHPASRDFFRPYRPTTTSN